MREDRLRNNATFDRLDYRVILDIVEEGSRVIDLGCGGGELLSMLAREKSVVGQGVEISSENIGKCMKSGVNAIQDSDGIKSLIAEFDRVWGEKVSRSREVLDVVGEIAP